MERVQKEIRADTQLEFKFSARWNQLKIEIGLNYTLGSWQKSSQIFRESAEYIPRRHHLVICRMICQSSNNSKSWQIYFVYFPLTFKGLFLSNPDWKSESPTHQGGRGYLPHVFIKLKLSVSFPLNLRNGCSPGSAMLLR